MQLPMTDRLIASESGIARAAELLQGGKLVAFGTETVYGLGGDASNALAVAAIFDAKDRPRFNPLICHYPSADAAFRHVIPNECAQSLAKQFWPGPLTLVLPRQPDCPVAPLAGAGLSTLAVRVPSHPVARALLERTGLPVAAPSANRSGSISPSAASHVLDELEGRIAAVLDCGPCSVGVESTVLDLNGDDPVLLRPGGVTLELLEAYLGYVRTQVGHGAAEVPRSPGLLSSHYAPQRAVRLNASMVVAAEGLLAFGPPLPGATHVFQLSDVGNVVQAASRLFEGLHHLDRTAGIQSIAVMPIPETGLGRAINDRLRRAAAPR